MNIEKGGSCQTLFEPYEKPFLSAVSIGWRITGLLLFAFSESKNQIHKPSDKRNNGNHPPERFFPNGAEILANDIDDGKNREQVKEHTDFYPYGNGLYVQFYPFKF